jgi:hypothetical protein
MEPEPPAEHVHHELPDGPEAHVRTGYPARPESDRHLDDLETERLCLQHDLGVSEPVVGAQHEAFVGCAGKGLRLTIDVPQPPRPEEEPEKGVEAKRSDGANGAVFTEVAPALRDIGPGRPQPAQDGERAFRRHLAVAVEVDEVVPVRDLQARAEVPAHSTRLRANDDAYVGVRASELFGLRGSPVAGTRPEVRDQNQLVALTRCLERLVQRIDDLAKPLLGPIAEDDDRKLRRLAQGQHASIGGFPRRAGPRRSTARRPGTSAAPCRAAGPLVPTS